VVVDASEDIMPPIEPDVAATDTVLDKPPKPNDKKGIKPKKNCHYAGQQYSKIPNFNYNYKVCSHLLFLCLVLTDSYCRKSLISAFSKTF
jgi:hypothetical protein